MPTQTESSGGGLLDIASSFWQFSLLYNMQNARKFGQVYIPWTGLPAAFFPDKELIFGNTVFSGRVAGPATTGSAARVGGKPLLRKAGVTLQFGKPQLAAKYSSLATFDKTKLIPKDTTKFVTQYTRQRVPGLLSKITTKRGISMSGRAAAAGILVGRAASVGFTAFNILFAADIIKGGFQLYGGIAAAAEKARGMDIGGSFFDTQQSYTSRQRSVQAINASHLQARSAIGNEAQLMHR